MSREEYFKGLISGERRGIADRLLFACLTCCAVPYGLFMRARAAAYKFGLVPSRRLPKPVISVGNITVGGTGKTPAVMLVAKELMARGKRVAVLTRGYGGSREGEVQIVSDGRSLLLEPGEAGDEPCLLATAVPGLMVAMGTDRYRAGCLALEKLDPDIFIMDDGFQHLRLKRDLDILLLDGTAPFATGRTLPAGLLREVPSAARRSDLVIYTRSEPGNPPDTGAVAGIPSTTSSHRISGCMPLTGGETKTLEILAGKRVIAFAGIADPAAFFDGLETQGVRLAATLAFPDHTPYGTLEMEALGRLKLSVKGDVLVTTAKDGVKLLPYSGILRDCFVAQLELVLHDPAPLHAALENFL